MSRNRYSFLIAYNVEEKRWFIGCANRKKKRWSGWINNTVKYSPETLKQTPKHITYTNDSIIGKAIKNTFCKVPLKNQYIISVKDPNEFTRLLKASNPLDIIINDNPEYFI